MWIKTDSSKLMSSFWPCTWWKWLKLADLYPSPCLKTWYLPLSVSYEDRLKENFARGSAELEKRRLALEEEQRKERERRDREEREAHERREREAREQENRRRLEEERRREMERQREEERLRELEDGGDHVCSCFKAAKQEMERQRREEWERGKREELGMRKEGEQEEISRLRAKKKSLELELEAVGNKHKQISDCLRDAKSKRRILKAEVDLVNQKRDARIIEINTLQLQFEDWQKKLSILIPEQQRLTEKLRSLNLNKISSVTLTSVSGSVNEKGVKCRRLKDQLDTLERETTDKLAEMEQYNKELKLGDMDDCVLRGLLSLLACLSQLFLLIKELREKQVRQQAVLDDLHRVKEEKVRELQRRKEEEMERKRGRKKRQPGEQAKLDQERREQEQIKKEEEEARQRRLLEEQRARQREEEEREAQARLRAAQEKAQEEERRRREEEEEEKKKREQEEEEKKKREQVEEEKKKREQVEAERKRQEEEKERIRRKEEQERGEQQPVLVAQPSSKLTRIELCTLFVPPFLPRDLDGKVADDSTVSAQADTSQSFFPLLARAVSSWSASSETHLNLSSGAGDVITPMLSFSQGDIISVQQQREDWWLGQLNGTQGWFPKSYVTLEMEFVALYTYESPEAGDLTFVEGDVVMVTEREGEWWRGCIGDHTGVFPSNYVRPVEPEVRRAIQKIAQAVSTTVAPTTHQLRLSPGQLIVVLAKNSTGWWLGELQARGKKRQRGWFHSSHVKLLGPSSSKSSPSPLPGDGTHT
ncbi:hypothetical protein F7725_019488 [Dissostichus mawsoni]|uniref:SH3 domain-containing protein n=1 Tax=Dissostichus mawsoni TaxID=36200 RepID=A0A7J5YLY2_DISMA|nr:hypothetical protein F7725_019488 [Dissostichus mawsoni]